MSEARAATRHLGFFSQWSKDTSRQFEGLKKPFVLEVKQSFYSNIQLWRLVSLHPVGVQRCAVPHFKGLIKTFKMRYSMFLCYDGIIFKFWFQKSRFTPKNLEWADTFLSQCTSKIVISSRFLWWLGSKCFKWEECPGTLISYRKDDYCHISLSSGRIL